MRKGRHESFCKIGPAFRAAAEPAYADLTPTDLLIAARTIGFMAKINSDDLRVGIVAASDSALSIRDANQLRSLWGNDLRAGKTSLRPVILRLDQVASADVDLFFLAEGVGADAGKVAGASKARKIPCITFDLAQVKSGAFTIGVRTRPKIEIFVNRKAAADSDTVFSSVFRLMITEY
jgi:hypothetical protein